MVDIDSNALSHFISCPNQDLKTKKQILEKITEQAMSYFPTLKYQTILDALIQRERLGSTIIGHGIAMPHARLESIDQTLCVLITLTEPIQFDSDDHRLVDVIFGLLVPKQATEAHLQLLAKITQKLQDPTFCDRLRAGEIQSLSDSH